MFYDQEDIYELILAIDDYINYYIYDRIKVKLKGLLPVNYRLQSSNQKLFINCPTFWGQFKKTAYIALGIQIGENETAKYWLGVLNKLKKQIMHHI